MKVHHLTALTGVALACSPLAFGFAEIGRGELLLSGTARELYDSRVFGGTSPGDDYIFTLEPKALYRHYAGELKLDSLLGVRLNRYASFTDLNSNDLEGDLKLYLPADTAAPVSGSFETSYDEHTEVNYDVNARIREKTFLSRLDAGIPVGLKMSLLLDGLFRHDNRNEFSNRQTRDGTIGLRYLDFAGGTAVQGQYRRLEVDTSGGNAWGIPLNQHSDTYTLIVSHPLYDQVVGSISYGYRVLDRSRAELQFGPIHSSGSVYSVNVNGPFLPASVFPKLESSAYLGYEKADTPGINDTGGSRLVGNLHLGWYARERTVVSVDAHRNRELSVNDLTVETTAFTATLRQGIGDFLHASITAGYERRDYRGVGRRDNVGLFGTSLDYHVTKYWSANAQYQLHAARSDAPTADYSRHLALVSVTYTF